jgi:hypothetical protein
VAADPIGTGSAADATFSDPADATRMTATVPPAAASASADAIRALFDLVSTASG